jgi:hypothetical protein
MSRYKVNIRREDRPWSIHPIWRGIGCIWLVILPVMAYAAAWLIVRQWFFTTRFQTMMRNIFITTRVNFIPQDMYEPIILPSIQLNQFYFDFNNLIRWLPGMPLYKMDVLVFLAFVFLGIGIASLIYALLYKSFGPPKNPYDAVEEPYRRSGPYG